MAFIAAVVAAITIALIGARRLDRDLYRPIRQLQEHAVALGRGDGKGLKRLQRDDDIGDLAKALYVMANDLEMQSQSVHFLAFHDPLTGLLNRTGFQSRLEEIFVELSRSEQRGALLFIDIDDFKEVNDSLGHEAGDRALRAISDRLRTTARGDQKDRTVQLARIGGDEFTLFLSPVTSDSQVVALAEEILTLLTAPVIADSERIHVSASIGIAYFPEDGETVSTLLNNADAAMYTSKHLGKGTYRYYEPSMNNALFRSSTIKAEFQQALRADDELELLFQPIYNLRTRKVVSAEALIRWHHPRLGHLSPEQFIAIVEHNEVALPTDLWVLDKAMDLVESINQSGSGTASISVNISASNLVRKQFTSSIQKLIRGKEALAKCIKLEVTETFLHSDDDEVRETIEKLRMMGFEIWLDDFGTGFSSLRHLKDFEVDGIKIDQTFVTNLADSSDNKKMVAAMIGLAEAFSVAVVAEGIDRNDTLGLLSDMGVMLGQGMALASPMSRAALLRLIADDSKARAKVG